MKRILKTNSSKGFLRTGPTPKVEPSPPAATTAPPRRKVTLSSLTSTAPRTAEDVRKAISQRRFAEMKPEQA